MIIVKLTILAVMITALYVWIWRAYLQSNPKEVFNIAFRKNYVPKGGCALIILLLIDVIGVFASAIYLLFFR